MKERTIKLTHMNQELKNSLEELSVTKEELRVRNEQLAVSQQVVEVERQRYQDLFDLAPDGYFVTNVHGVIQEANHVAIALLGLHEASPVGISLQLYVTERDRQAYLRHLSQLRDAEKVQFFELNLRSRQGRCFPAAISVIATRHPEGQIIRLRWMIRDITDFKQVEASLRQSEELKERILESSDDCISVLTLNGQILYMSRGGLSLLEIDDPTSVLNMDWVSFLQGEDYENAKAAISVAKAGGIGQSQGSLSTMKGQPKWWDNVISPIRDALGNVIQLVVISRDITKQKQAEDLLRASEQRFRNMADNAPMMIWVTDPTGYCTYLSRSWYDFSGQTEETGLGLGWLDVIHPDDRESSKAIFLVANDRQEAFQLEYRLCRQDGQYRTCIDAARPWFGADGEFKGYIGSVIDIEDRQQAEATLRQSEERYRTLFELIDEGFCIIEVLFDENDTPSDYRFLEINPSFEQQTGLRQAIGKTARQLVPNLEAHWIRIYGQVALTGEPARFENGSEAMNRWFDVYACRIDEPEARKVAIVFKDISEAKRAEAERDCLLQREQAARAAAEQANRTKDEFLAVLSHELRSPLNPILGWSGLLRKGRLDPEKTAHGLQTIERNAKLQVQLIEDLLDVSRIMQGKLKLNIVPVNLADTIRASLETVQLAANNKAIHVQIRFDSEVGPVLGDSARLQQIIWNLLANAVKFTPEGGQVEIELKRMGAQAQIQVRDTGKGIDPDFLPHVFEYFQQADSGSTRNFGGLGLGLAIVRHLVELHGGTVQANSPGDGQGTIFTVSLPLLRDADRQMRDEPEDSPRLTSHSSPLAGLRVLLVDDDSDSRDLIAFMLKQSGAIVTGVASAADALQAFTRTRFDVLTSDIGMPEMDGYLLIRQIRAMPTEQGGKILAIALTAYAGELDQQQAISAGFQKHMAKPVEPEVLVQTIVSLVGKRSATDVGSDILQKPPT